MSALELTVMCSDTALRVKATWRDRKESCSEWLIGVVPVKV